LFTKIHFKIELLFSYTKKHFFLVLAAIALITLSIIFKNQIISFYRSPIWHPKIIGLQGLYTLDTLPSDISQQISYGLTISSDTNKPIPSPLVKSIDIQNNNKDYIFTLNDNIFWSNGKKFTAHDINYQIPGLEIDIISNYQVKISTQEQFSPILSVLSKPIFKKNLVGLGEYQVKKITYQEGYLKSISLTPKDKTKNSIEYRFYYNENDVIDAYKIGNVNEIRISSLPTEFTKWNKTKISQKIETNQKYIAIFLNTQKIANKQTRQALAYATPKVKDKNERCLGPISPTSWAYNSTVKEYNFSSIRAKELFEKNKIDKINLSINNRELLPLAENIKNNWQDILKIETSITIENQIDLQNFDAILTYGAIPNDPDQYSFWHSTQTNTNITKLNNSRIDKLLEEGRQTIDQLERKKIYQDFQRYLLEESPAIFLYYPTTYTITRSI